MLRFVCLNIDNYQGQGVDYVNILHDMVRRNLRDGTAGEFVCLTNQVGGDYHPDIDARLLPLGPPHITGWWHKLRLFAPMQFMPHDRIVYFDLDTLIAGPIDRLADLKVDFAILEDFYRPGGMQSSIMCWTVSRETEAIYKVWEQNGFPCSDPLGDQGWIESRTDQAKSLQSLLPGMFCSYKVTRGEIPTEASVVVFHGRPKPHEENNWVAKVWKIGGLQRAELDARCNTDIDDVFSNIRANRARNYVQFEPKTEANDEHICIVGGGPSLDDKDVIDELKWRISVGQKVMALNGAGKHLKEKHGIDADLLCICDARPDNIRFLYDGRHTHLLASQCDPVLVREAYENGGVVLWHPNLPGVENVLDQVYVVGGGSTVGLNAIALAHAQGYRLIHLYGFDSSYRGDQHHAYEQALNDGEPIVEAIHGDKSYKCAPWMVKQVEEYRQLALSLQRDAIITAHGSGLLVDVAASIHGMVYDAAAVRANEVLKRLNGAGVIDGVEVGVFTGAMSAALLRDPRVWLDMVDSWEANGAAYAGETGDFHAKLSAEAQEAHYEQAQANTAFAEDRRFIFRMRSAEAAKHPDIGKVDFVFIDADHSYEGCKADIIAWAPHVKRGGLLCGHDYGNPAGAFGVKQAVDEYAAWTGQKVDLGENYTWFVSTSSQTGQQA